MKILTVSELTQEIKTQLETKLGPLAVQGEVIGLKTQGSGHIYFTLKDNAAQLSAVLFQGTAKNLTRLPKEGDQIIAIGQMSVYAPRGTYQILVREVQYKGIGELLAQLHERKNRLQAQGLFAKDRKKKLPPFPKTIGVVTSPTGAVIQDIIQILQRRHEGFHLILNPVKVQGEGAKEEIAKAIDEFNQYTLADVLIVGRGGGSLEDLWPFNEEIVVQAIARSRIPIISAVGHETDFSLSDFAADVRAPTPSAAAELVLTEKKQRMHFLNQIQGQIEQKIFLHIKRLKQHISTVKKNPYLVSPYLLLSRRMQELDDFKSQLSLAIATTLKQKKAELSSLEKRKRAKEPSYQIRLMRQKLLSTQKSLAALSLHMLQTKKKNFTLAGMQKRLDLSCKQILEKKKESLYRLSSHLHAIDPKNLLTKGYCILFSENKDSVILSTKQIIPPQNLKILLQDGTITAKVQEVTYESI